VLVIGIGVRSPLSSGDFPCINAEPVLMRACLTDQLGSPIPRHLEEIDRTELHVSCSIDLLPLAVIWKNQRPESKPLNLLCTNLYAHVTVRHPSPFYAQRMAYSCVPSSASSVSSTRPSVPCVSSCDFLPVPVISASNLVLDPCQGFSGSRLAHAGR
jgi:hypothetical protein